MVGMLQHPEPLRFERNTQGLTGRPGNDKGDGVTDPCWGVLHMNGKEALAVRSSGLGHLSLVVAHRRGHRRIDRNRLIPVEDIQHRPIRDIIVERVEVCHHHLAVGEAGVAGVRGRELAVRRCDRAVGGGRVGGGVIATTAGEAEEGEDDAKTKNVQGLHGLSPVVPYYGTEVLSLPKGLLKYWFTTSIAHFNPFVKPARGRFG